MLHIPENSSKLALIIGIDPGSNTLGVCWLMFDLETMRIVSTIAKTYKGETLAGDCWIDFTYGPRVARIYAHEENLYRIFEREHPLFIASESPFMSSSHPSAYGALTEVICAIRSAIYRYDLNKTLYLIDPPSVKIAVGAKGNAGKDDVKKCVLALSNQLNYRGMIPLELLDEHSIDSIAVAYARLRSLQEEE